MDHTRHPRAHRHRSRSGHVADALGRTERHLSIVSRTQGRDAVDRWCTGCPDLAGSGTSTGTGTTDDPRSAGTMTAAEVPGWLHDQPTDTANRVLGHLVGVAQSGDQLALVVVLVCLGPGIRTLAARTGVRVDEVVSEVALGAMTFPVARRTSVAGGLLLDARNRLGRAARRAGRTEPLGDEAAHPVAPGELGTVVPAAQQVVQIVSQAHRDGVVDRTEARLILDTRVGGHGVRPVAHRLGLTPTAAYQRRTRAEKRLTRLP
jgi:hypothetical protein